MPRTDDDLDREVLHILLHHQGKQNRIGRWELVENVFGEPVPAELQNDDNMGDRMIRYSVGRLRAAGHLICDLGDGSGRWIAANETEFWEFYGYYIKPIKTKAEVARALKKAAEEKWPNLMQPSLFDMSEFARAE
jgi:hypothetical protein